MKRILTKSKSIFAARLKYAMDIRGLSASEVCRIASAKYPQDKLCKSHMSEYLKGNVFPNAPKRELLAKILHVNQDWLAGLSDDMEREGDTLPSYLVSTPTNTSSTPLTIGEKIRTARYSLRLSQKDLSKQLGIPKSALSKIELGQMPAKNSVIEKLSEISGYPEQWFVETNEQGNARKTLLNEMSPQAQKKMEFAKRLQEAMILRGVKQSDIVRAAQKNPPAIRIEKAHISAYLHGKYIPSQERTAFLAEFLSVDPLWLIGTSEENEEPEHQPKNEEKELLWEKFCEAAPRDKTIVKAILGI